MAGALAANERTIRAGSGVADHPAGPVLLAIGSASVVLTSTLYALVPSAAVMQTLSLPPGSLADAQAGMSAMRWAGTSGVIGNLVMAAGALLLAIDRGRRGDGRVAGGWALIVMSLFAFELVDGLTGFALPEAAARSAEAYAILRSLYAALFLAGTLVFGLGAILAVEPREKRGWRRWVAWSAVVEGTIALVSTSVGMAGVGALWPLVGLSIAAGAVTFVFMGLDLALANR